MALANGSAKILVVGDSLSAGYGLERGESWVDLLQNRLHALGYEYQVINASISGDTTAGGLARLGPALARYSPAVVVIELGGNDGLRGLSLAVVRRNLHSMIEQARAANAEVVLLGMRIPTNYGKRYTERFHALYGDLARRFELSWISFFMDGVATDTSLMQSDGIHPSAEAQPLLLDNAWCAIQAVLPETGEDDCVYDQSKAIQD